MSDKTNGVRAFISHSTKDLSLVNELSEGLEEHGIKAFVAHRDIRISQAWLERILQELETCDVVIPFITQNFRKSGWTDQECGIALAHKKHFVPIWMKVPPHGFINRFQGVRLKTEGDLHYEFIRKVIGGINEHPALAPRVRSLTIERFLGSASYNESAKLAYALERFDDISAKEMNWILERASLNSQIYQATVARRLVNALLSQHTNGIDQRFLKRWKSRIGLKT